MELAKIYEHEAELRLKQLESLSQQRHRSNAEVAAMTRLRGELNSLLATFEACDELVSGGAAGGKCQEFAAKLAALAGGGAAAGSERGSATLALEADLATLDSILALSRRAETHGAATLANLAQQGERLQAATGGLHAIDHNVAETHKGLTRINRWWNTFTPG